MKKRVFSSLAVMALSASFAFSQPTTTTGTHTPPTSAQRIANRVARLTTLLTLTTAQQTEATTIFTNLDTALSATRTNMQTARTALKTAVEKNDTAGISNAALQIGNLTAQEVQAQATAEAAFYALLTPDQKTKYAEVRGPGLGGPGGPGGMGPRGMGGRMGRPQ